MKNTYYINLRCKKCARYVGATVQGSLNEEKAVGCRQCGTSTTIKLRDGGSYHIGDFEISTGIYQPYDS